MAPRPLVYANALGIDPHIQAIFAAFSQDEDRPRPGAEQISLTPPLTPPSHQARLLPGALLQRIISISDSDEEAPKVSERRAGKQPERRLNDARTGVGSPRKISLGDSKLDDIMARVSLDGEDNGESSDPHRFEECTDCHSCTRQFGYSWSIPATLRPISSSSISSLSTRAIDSATRQPKKV